MFNQLFKKKEKAFHFNDMFNTYYQQGKDYFHKNDFEYAVHYLDQAYALTLSLEDLDVSEEKIENCSQMLLQLEKEETLIMKTIENIKEMAEHLTYDQRSLWNLLTLCRLEVIFKEVAHIPECQLFTRVPDLIDLLYQIITGKKEYDESDETDFLDELYELSDSQTFYNPHTTFTFSFLEKPIQLLDFIGGDVLTSLELFIDQETNYTEINDFSNDFVVSALGILKSYYLRTQNHNINEISQIQNELTRIKNDYELIKNIPDEETFILKMNTYRQMNIFE